MNSWKHNNRYRASWLCGHLHLLLLFLLMWVHQRRVQKVETEVEHRSINTLSADHISGLKARRCMTATAQRVEKTPLQEIKLMFGRWTRSHTSAASGWRWGFLCNFRQWWTCVYGDINPNLSFLSHNVNGHIKPYHTELMSCYDSTSPTGRHSTECVVILQQPGVTSMWLKQGKHSGQPQVTAPRCETTPPPCCRQMPAGI